MKIIVQYSSGKDSQAALIWAVNKYGAKNITAQFSDTKWEKKTSYIHLEETCMALGVKLVKLTSKKYDGMVGLAKNKKRFPSTMARFCTSELKIIPFIDWILDEVKDNLLIIQGIRSDESYKRSTMSAECSLFKYYFLPYTNNYIKLAELEHHMLKLRRKGKEIPKIKFQLKEILIDKLQRGYIENKYHTYRKKEIKKYLKEFDDSILRPMFDKTGQWVINYIIENGQQPNVLYSMGAGRVGCYPCIMVTLQELRQMALRDPERIKELIKIEEELGTSFFPPDKIPKRFCANGKFPTVQEVVDYVLGNPNQTELFQDEDTSCMSYYGLCSTE